MEISIDLSLEDLGVWWDDNGIPRFPDDTLVIHPDSCARYCASLIDSADLVFLNSRHYNAMQRNCLSRDGHWFAVAGDLLIDPWACWAELLGSCVLATDSDLAQSLYAGPWERLIAA